MPQLHTARRRLHSSRILQSTGAKEFAHLDRSELRSFLQRCGRAGDLVGGKMAHAFLLKSSFAKDKFLLNLVIEMYGKCGRAQDAALAFKSIPQPNAFSWNNLITAYARNGHYRDAIHVYRRLNLEGAEVDKFVLSSAIAACSSSGNVSEGRAIHSRALAGGLIDTVMAASLITMYSSCGSLEEARCAFQAKDADAFSWTAMIAAFAQHGHPEKAIDLFWELHSRGVKPDNATFVSTLDCCASLRDLRQGEAIHRLVDHSDLDTRVGSVLVDMYAKCGNLDKAWCIFRDMASKNAVTWTTMVSAYAQAGFPERAFLLLQEMDMEGIAPTGITFVGILDGLCRSSLGIGKKLHSCIAENGYMSDVMVTNAVVNMYGRCGSCENAKMVFDSMSSRTLVSWSSMVAAYAQNGYPLAALGVSQAMDLEGIQKNQVMFVSTLSSCNNAGLLDDALAYILSMRQDHGLKPSVKHYTCIIDLLGKAGRLEEAEQVITSAVDLPDEILWRTLLTGCKLHGDTERAARTVQRIDSIKT